MAARSSGAGSARHRAMVEKSWQITGDDPAARARRTAPARLAAARKVIAELEAQRSEGSA